MARCRAAPAGPLPASREELRGQVALFTTCYGNRNEPDLATDLVAVFTHNDIPVRLVPKERCCGMPRLELGDLKTVAAYKEENIPQLLAVIARRLRHRGADSQLRADVQAGAAADVSARMRT